MPGELSITPDASTNGGKIFPCAFCQRPFARREHRKRHERIHTKEKPYRCHDCPRSFARSDLLVRHRGFSHGAKAKNTHAFTAIGPLFGQDPLCADNLNSFPSIASENSNFSQALQPEYTISTQSLAEAPEADINISSYTFPSDFDSLSIPSLYCSQSFFNGSLHGDHQIPLDEVLNLPASCPTSGLNEAQDTNSRLFCLPPRIGSTLSSHTPEAELNTTDQWPSILRPFWDVGAEDRELLLANMNVFDSYIPEGFLLPSCNTVSRYLTGYVNNFHNHLPFIHISTFKIRDALPELILAMAAVGAQYCFERAKGIELFKVAKTVAFVRTHQDVKSFSQKSYVDDTSGLFTDTGHDIYSIQSFQTLLLLMAMGTWSGTKSMYGEALTMHNTLVTMIREHGLSGPERPASASWEDWVEYEGAKRTNLMICCFSTWHCIIYNTVPAIMTTELDMNIPCSETEWRASTAADWQIIHCSTSPGPKFQDCFTQLFNDNRDTSPSSFSSLTSYLLILAIIQQIFLIRQVTKCRPYSNDNLSSSEISSLEQALKNWQLASEQPPTPSPSEPKIPAGPMAFNSTALLRSAYLRLHIDVGPYRALHTQDPSRIAHAMFHSPPLKRSPSLAQAAARAANALSFPVKLGVNLVARHQIFTWSSQHSVCALESALVLCKWLDAVLVEKQPQEEQPPLTGEERELLDFVTEMLVESRSEEMLAARVRVGWAGVRLSAQVVRLWGKVFCGERVWNVVDVIGRAMKAYGDLLDGRVD